MGDVCGGGGYLVSAGDVLDGIVVFAVVVMGNFSGNSDNLSGSMPMMIKMWGEVGWGLQRSNGIKGQPMLTLATPTFYSIMMENSLKSYQRKLIGFLLVTLFN